MRLRIAINAQCAYKEGVRQLGLTTTESEMTITVCITLRWGKRKLQLSLTI